MPQIPRVLSVTVSPLEKISNFYASHKKAIMIVGAVLVGLILIKQLFFKPAVITVIGSGKLQVTPATVEMTVTRVDSSIDPVVAVNQGENNTKVLIDESKILLASPEIQRAFYQITPTVVGGDKLYQVVNVFKLTSFEPAKTSEVIKSLYTKGAVTISNVSFLPAEQADVTQEARKAALKDARAQARKIAQAAGKRLGRIVTISDDLSQVAGTLSSKEATGDFVSSDFLAAAPEKIEVAKVVSVTYEIW